VVKLVDGNARSGHLASVTRRTEERWRQWRHAMFGPASEQPFGRRATDWVRLTVAALFLAILVADYGSPSSSELGLFRFFNGLPSDLTSFFTLLYRAGALWAVGVVVVASLVAQRWRLALQLAAAGVTAWLAARLIGVFVVNGASATKGLDVATRFGSQTPAFPLVRLTVVVAIIATAGPYLTRPMRRLGQLLIVAMALGAMYLGTGLPADILAALFLGWGTAALVHLIFGSPGGRPTRAQVGVALAELGVNAAAVELDPAPPGSTTIMHARDGEGDLTIRVLGRDEADAQFFAKLWRLAAYRDGGPNLHLTRMENVEHQAYTMLLAERAGVRVPTVVVAGEAGPGTALLAERTPHGPRLDDANEPTDAVLDDLWKQVVHLQAAGVAHGSLNANHIVLGEDGPVITDFSSASAAAPDQRLAADVAELLLSTALIVGNDRAITAAVRGLGADGVAAALPLLQPAALSRELRPRARRKRKDLNQQVTDLREATAAAVGVEPPPMQQLYRIDGTQLLMAVGTLIAVFALLSQVGDPQTFWNTIKNADWVLLAAALVISFLTNFATAFSLMGTVPLPLPIVRTAELQLSMSFSNLAVPAVGGMAAQIRFLQRQGVDLASAVASGGLLANVGNVVALIMLFVVALALSPTKLDVGQVNTQGVAAAVLIIILVVLVVIGLVVGIPKLRRAVMPPITSAASTIWEALRSPRRVALLLGGNMVNALMYAGVMALCIEAFGGHLSYWTVLSINIVVGTFASLVPIPGGGTAVGAVGMSGGLTAVGVPTEIAVAAVLANQLVANFIPAVPGWFATNDLLHDQYL
jgi:uncharacterized membrane protein YbhN (UPF0104 family)/tRNA A-37 threonylcarbamoyl transferase component Bud32